MNVFDEAKQEIKEMIKLAKNLLAFDTLLMNTSISPTEAAFERKRKNEERYVELLAKYT